MFGHDSHNNNPGEKVLLTDVQVLSFNRGRKTTRYLVEAGASFLFYFVFSVFFLFVLGFGFGVLAVSYTYTWYIILVGAFWRVLALNEQILSLLSPLSFVHAAVAG